MEGFEPVHFAEFKLIQTSETQDTTVEVEAGATNIGDDTLPSTVIVEVKPVDVTAVFGLGPNQGDSKGTLEDYLNDKKVKKDQDVWFLRIKDKGDNDVFPSVRVADSETVLLGSLKAKGHTVVFDGHSNHGVGPWFSDPAGDPNPVAISDFTNLAGEHTWIPSSQCEVAGDWVDYTGNDHPDVLIAKADFPLAPANYLVPVLLEPRFDNDNNVAPGAQPMVPGQTFTRTIAVDGSTTRVSHYEKNIGTAQNPIKKRAIVKAGKDDLPMLRYKHFFYNACNTGRDYIENFDQGTFIYTKKSCAIAAATKIFVEEYLKQHTIAEVVQKLDQVQAGGPTAPDAYDFKDF